MTSALDLAKDMRALADMAAKGELTQEDIEDTVEGIQGSIGDKLDRIYDLMAVFADNKAAMTKRKKEAADREGYWQRQIDQLSQYAVVILETVPKNNVVTPSHTYYIQRGAPSYRVTDLAKLPDDYTEVTPVINPLMDKIRDALKSGEKVPGADVSPGKVGFRVR